MLGSRQVSYFCVTLRFSFRVLVDHVDLDIPGFAGNFPRLVVQNIRFNRSTDGWLLQPEPPSSS